jgi:ABC-2 type transport system ATP-binding protein
VLFLDEPTVGLDPQTRALVWEDVLRLRREEQMTIFLTTHYMDEAEYADRVAIIDHGQIVAAGTPDELKRQVGADTVELVTVDNPAAAAHLEAAGFRVRRGEEQLVVFAEDGEALVPQLIEAAGVRVRTVHVHRPTLDDVCPVAGAHLLFLEKSRRKNRNTFSASRKIDAAISGAESMSVERRSRWKSDMVRPAKTTSPMIE